MHWVTIGVTAGLGLITLRQIMAWKRRTDEEYFESGGFLPEPGKYDPYERYGEEAYFSPTYGPEWTEPAPHPTDPNKAAYLQVQGRLVRGLDMNREPPHWGLDLSAPIGTPVFAALGGQVVGSNRISGYGNTVQISHGNCSTLYAHLNQPAVYVGQQVTGGDIIGEVGRTTEGEEELTSPWGTVMGAHLHFEIHPVPRPILTRTFRRLDPIRWLAQQGIAQYRERW
jgi:murein DD-endopeptidase MepM/ murein hydrolase activator NlpD